MTNPYQALTTYEGDDWGEYLERICLLEVFGDLLPLFPTPESMRKIIRYIAWAYSPSSDRIIIGMEWEANKRQIFQQAGLAGPDNWNAVGLLQDATILQAIHAWLEFQGESVFKQLQCLKELKMEMQLAANWKIKKTNDEIDYDQKFKNAGYANDLDKMIQQLEGQYIQNNTLLKDAIKEIKPGRRALTVGPERFSQ